MSAARSCRDLVLGIHTPDRSGWPSAAFGAGALRSGLPSAPRGTPGVGVSSHCAESGAARMAAKTSPILTVITIGPIGLSAQLTGYRTTSGLIVVSDPHRSNQSIPSH